MASRNDADSSNVLSFPGLASEMTLSAYASESIVTAEGLVLMRAFLGIASSEDRKKVIALAEQLGRRDDRTAEE
jgi:hypothetical protein